MIILDGQKLADKILSDIKEEVEKRQLKLKIAVVLVGENSVSKSYINKKQEACEKTGIGSEIFNFPVDIEAEELKNEVKKLGENKEISGIVIQLPLPSQILQGKTWEGEPKNLALSEFLNLVPIEKDIDVLSGSVFKKFENNETDIFPPVVSAIKKLLEEYNITITGKKILVVGKGRLVGKPVSVWLKNIGADFATADSKTENLGLLAKESDIIISGAGSPEIIKKEIVKPGAVLIDCGTSSEGGVIKGDIEKSAYDVAGYVAPVPGGVGPLAVACLLDNLVKLNI